MKLVSTIFLGIAIVLFILGFLSWRLEFELPKFDYLYYIIAGLILGLITIWGRVLSEYIKFLSIFPFGYALILLLLDKSSTWSNMSTPVFIGLGLLSFGFVLQIIGSESVKISTDDEARHAAKQVFCAACDQYLGRAGGFSSPCPRCGSNRYVVGN